MKHGSKPPRKVNSGEFGSGPTSLQGAVTTTIRLAAQDGPDRGQTEGASPLQSRMLTASHCFYCCSCISCNSAAAAAAAAAAGAEVGVCGGTTAAVLHGKRTSHGRWRNCTSWSAWRQTKAESLCLFRARSAASNIPPVGASTRSAKRPRAHMPTACVSALPS